MVLPIVIVQKMHEVQQVGIVEGAVFKTQQSLKIIIGMVQHKVVRCIVHTPQQLRAFVNDNGAIAPGKNSSKKSGNLYVLQLAKLVRYYNGIIFYKRWPVVLLHFVVKKIFKLVDSGLLHAGKDSR